MFSHKSKNKHNNKKYNLHKLYNNKNNYNNNNFYYITVSNSNLEYKRKLILNLSNVKSIEDAGKIVTKMKNCIDIEDDEFMSAIYKKLNMNAFRYLIKTGYHTLNLYYIKYLMIFLSRLNKKESKIIMNKLCLHFDGIVIPIKEIWRMQKYNFNEYKKNVISSILTWKMLNI